MKTMLLFVVVAAAATAHAQHLGDNFDDENNELTSIDVQEGDTVKLECRLEKNTNSARSSDVLFELLFCLPYLSQYW